MLIQDFIKNLESLEQAKVSSKEKSSLTNITGWQALTILATGTLDDKAKLVKAVSKGSKFESSKGIVSKAKRVLHAFEQDGSITYTNRDKSTSTITFDKVKEADATLYEVAISSLYKAISTESDTISDTKALEIGANSIGLTLQEAKALDSTTKEQLIEAGRTLHTASQPVNKVESSLDAVKEAANSLSDNDLGELVDFLVAKLDERTAKVA